MVFVLNELTRVIYYVKFHNQIRQVNHFSLKGRNDRRRRIDGKEGVTQCLEQESLFYFSALSSMILMIDPHRISLFPEQEGKIDHCIRARYLPIHTLNSLVVDFSMNFDIFVIQGNPMRKKILL